MRRLGRWMGWTLLGLVGLLVVTEIALRVGGHFYLNRLYAGAHPRPDDINILCLGESSTYGLWLSPGDSYPGQLEKRLREHYRNDRIHVVVPPHVGQNTSEMANRISEYLSRYRPRMVIVMAGVNNQWSLGESHIGRFLTGEDSRSSGVKAQIALSRLRTYKLLRHLYLSLTHGREAAGMNRNTMWGQAEYTPYPPPAWVFDFARRNQDAFVQLWRYDVGAILDESKRRGATAVLMTYHLNPYELDLAAQEALAREKQVTWIRNDLAFTRFANEHTLDRYLMQDHWHPNRDGYAVIAGNVFDEVTTRDLLGLGR